MIHSPADIAATLSGTGFDAPSTIVGTAIVLAESGGDDGARNPQSGEGPSGYHFMGWWQIGSMHLGQTYTPPGGSSRQLTEADCYNPGIATGYAWWLSHGGADWQPWQTYTQGTYKSRLPDAQKGAANEGNADNLSPSPTDLLTSAINAVFGPLAQRLAAGLVNGGLVVGGTLMMVGGVFLAVRMVQRNAPTSLRGAVAGTRAAATGASTLRTIGKFVK